MPWGTHSINTQTERLHPTVRIRLLGSRKWLARTCNQDSENSDLISHSSGLEWLEVDLHSLRVNPSLVLWLHLTWLKSTSPSGLGDFKWKSRQHYTLQTREKKKHTTNQSKEMLHSPEFLFSSAPSATPQKYTTHNGRSKHTQVQPRSQGSAISMATAFDPNSTLWDEWFNLEVGGRVSWDRLKTRAVKGHNPTWQQNLSP
jgi:hypothetical protein